MQGQRGETGILNLTGRYRPSHMSLRDTCTIFGKGPGPFAGKRRLYDPACFVDDEDFLDVKRSAEEQDALPTGIGFDEPMSVDAFLASLKDPAAEEEEAQQEQNKGNEQAMGAAAAAAAAPSTAASSRAGTVLWSHGVMESVQAQKSQRAGVS